MSNVIRVVSRQEAEAEAERRREGPISRQVREQDEANVARRSRELADAARNRTLGRR